MNLFLGGGCGSFVGIVVLLARLAARIMNHALRFALSHSFRVCNVSMPFKLTL